MTLSDYQISIGGLVLGPTTDYTIHKIDGLGVPEIRDSDTRRPIDHGDFYGLDFLSGRTVTVEATVRGSTAAEAVTNLQTLSAQWQPVATTAAATRPLSFKFPGQVEKEIRGRPRRMEADTSRILGSNVGVLLEYRAADPRIYAVSGDSTGVAIFQAGGTRSYSRTFSHAYAGGGAETYIYATNSGNFSTRPVATIVGPCTNPRVENVTTGEFVECETTLLSTDSLVIDFDARTIVLNGTASRYSTITTDSTWWELAPGTTTVRFMANAYDAAALLTLAWASAWI